MPAFYCSAGLLFQTEVNQNYSVVMVFVLFPVDVGGCSVVRVVLWAGHCPSCPSCPSCASKSLLLPHGMNSKTGGLSSDFFYTRDFAFVTHDAMSDTYKCHVLRCDLPARRIAQALKELCQDYIAKHAHRSGRSKTGMASKRPHTLPLGLQRQSTLLSSGNVFPTPTEEPKKIFNVRTFSVALFVAPESEEFAFII